MATSLNLALICSFNSPNKPGVVVGKSVAGKVLQVNRVLHNSNFSKLQSFEVKAGKPNYNPDTKPNSILCADCEGNGAKVCGQCQGSGVNSQDHFNGQFKAGQLCWLCRGKKEVLCGNCNGAGFIGGLMSTFDD